eukprot:181715-Amorphochlora_amoeboformis.AAC.1
MASQSLFDSILASRIILSSSPLPLSSSTILITFFSSGVAEAAPLVNLTYDLDSLSMRLARLVGRPGRISDGIFTYGSRNMN